MMKRLTQTARVTLSFSLLLVCRMHLGAEPRSLSLDEAVKLAVAQDITLQKNGIDLATAEFAAKNTWSEIFSVINPSASLAYRTPLVSNDGPQLNAANGTYSLQTGVKLSFKTGLPQTMKLTALTRQSQQLTYERRQQQVMFDVTKSFYTLLAGQDNLSNLEKSLASAERKLEKNSISFEYGLISRLEHLQSRLSVETARLTLNKAQVSYMADMRTFLALLGLNYDPHTTLAGTLAVSRIDLDPDRLIERYLPQRPDMLAQQYIIEENELKAKKQALSPWLDASVGWTLGTGTTSPGSLPLNQTPHFADSLSASVTLTIPIDNWIPGTANNQALRSVNAATEKARLDMQNTENTARKEIRSCTDNLRNSWSSIEIARLQVEIAEQTYALSEEGFEQGVVDSLTQEENRNKLSDAQYQLLQAELAYYSLTLDLAAALNMTTQELMELTL
jgi:outer membrane protein TolC